MPNSKIPTLNDISDEFSKKPYKRVFRSNSGYIVKIYTTQKPLNNDRPTERAFLMTASLCNHDGHVTLTSNGIPEIRAPHQMIFDLAHNEDVSSLFNADWAMLVDYMEQYAIHRDGNSKLSIAGVEVTNH